MCVKKEVVMKSGLNKYKSLTIEQQSKVITQLLGKQNSLERKSEVLIKLKTPDKKLNEKLFRKSKKMASAADAIDIHLKCLLSPDGVPYWGE